MFHAVEKFRTPAQILLGLIAVSFVGFGVAGLDLSSNNQYIVKIGDEAITRSQLDRAVQNMQAAGGTSNRDAVFNTLVDQAYLVEGAKKIGLHISDEQIKQNIVDNPNFHDSNHKFDPALFQAFVRQNFVNEAQFMEQERQRLMLLSLINTLNSGVVADSQAEQLFISQLATRKIRSVPIVPESFANKVATDDESLKKYYETNLANYVEPQAVKYEYVVISPKDLLSKQTVTEEEITKTLGEQTDTGTRRIAHILIEAPKSADANTREQAKRKAEEIDAKLKANPNQFAQIAQEYSEDVGSKNKGGDLGVFSKNGLLGSPSLEEVAFTLKDGEISSVVESDFGYHILRVSEIELPDIKAEREKVRQQIKERKAQTNYAQLREDFGYATFKDFNGLKPVAEQFGLTVHTHEDWLTATTTDNKLPEEVRKVLFSDDMLKKQHTSEGIAVNGDTWFVRATEVRPSRQLSFEEVKDTVKTDWVHTESIRLAEESAKQFLTELQAGKKPLLAWSPVQEVHPQQIRFALPDTAYHEFMNAIPKGNQPAYAVVNIQSVPQLVEVQSIAPMPKEYGEQTAIRQLLVQNNGNNLIEAFIDELRSEIKTKQGAESVHDD